MSCCGYRTVNGAPPGSVPSGGGAVAEQGVQVEAIDPLAPSGSVETSVILFDGATTQLGAVPLTIVRTDSAANGTTIELPQGVYQLNWFVGMGNAAQATYTLSRDATLAQRTGVSLLNSLTVYDAQFTIGNGPRSLTCSTVMVVTPAHVAALANTLRVLGFITTSGLPVPGASYANPADPVIKIWRIGDAA